MHKSVSDFCSSPHGQRCVLAAGLLVMLAGCVSRPVTNIYSFNECPSGSASVWPFENANWSGVGGIAHLLPPAGLVLADRQSAGRVCS